MNRKAVVFVVITIFSASLSCAAQTQEATQLLLNYEKLKQLEEILDNMYKGYKILMQGYNRIKNIAEGNYKLHQVFLDGLYTVSPSVRKYARVADIIRYQQILIREYKRAYDRFRNDNNLTREELRYLGTVYAYLVKQSLRNLDELTTILTSSKLRMSDDERMTAIDHIYDDMLDKVGFLRYLNNSTQLLIIQRSKERSEVESAKNLQDIK